MFVDEAPESSAAAVWKGSGERNARSASSVTMHTGTLPPCASTHLDGTSTRTSPTLRNGHIRGPLIQSRSMEPAQQPHPGFNAIELQNDINLAELSTVQHDARQNSQ